MSPGRTLLTSALVAALAVSTGVVNPPAAAATGKSRHTSGTCTDAGGSGKGLLAVTRPAGGGELAVDEYGKITIRGSLDKKARMVDVTVGKARSTDFEYGRKRHKSATWSTTLRPPRLGVNQLCARAERREESRGWGKHHGKQHGSTQTDRILRSFTVVDRIPPGTVPGLAVGDVTASTAKVTWQAATDNYGLAGYDVTVDGGTTYRTTVGNRSYAITGLAPSSTHTVAVVAVDLAGNVSATPATATFTTDAGSTTPPTPGLSIDPLEGSATATWQPDPADVTYRAYLDGQLVDEFPLAEYCQAADGWAANPCTAQNSIVFPIEPLDEYTPYLFRVDALRADGTLARSLTASFTTMIGLDVVSPAATQLAASEGSRCASMGGDLYLAADARAAAPAPAGSTEVFAGCYTAADTDCIDDFLPPSGDKVMDCVDDVTKYLYSTAPPGRGPVLSSLDDLPAFAGPSLVDANPVMEALTWCVEEEACIFVVAHAAEIVALAEVAPAAVASINWVVVAAAGIGIGLVLWAILEILFPGEIAFAGLIEYPIHPDDNFDNFDNWGGQKGQWYHSLKIYAEVVKTTKQVASRHSLPFAWTDQLSQELKQTIDSACGVQRGGQFPVSGCGDGFAVYVPGAQSHSFRPMPETGKHIVEAMGNGDYPTPRARKVWYWPEYDKGGKAGMAAYKRRDWYDWPPYAPNAECSDPPRVLQACDEFPFFVTNQAVNLSGTFADIRRVPSSESSPQGSDTSQFYRRCGVQDGEHFMVLPVRPWVEANGPSFGFNVTPGGASLCLVPGPK